jgi:phage terminase large subunit GpA-like protein
MQNSIRLPVWMVGTDTAKTIIYEKAQLDDGIGKWTFPSNDGLGYDEQFFKEMFSEVVSTKYSFGRPYKVFRPTAGIRNEPLDCAVYALAAITVLNPNFTACHDRLTAKAVDPIKDVKDYRASRFSARRF